MEAKCLLTMKLFALKEFQKGLKHHKEVITVQSVNVGI